MVAFRAKFPYSFVIMNGDNIYEGPASAADYLEKFEKPYQRLLDRRREILRRARQPRRSPSSELRAVQHGGTPLSHVSAARRCGDASPHQRTVLRHRHGDARPAAAAMAPTTAQRVGFAVEDLFLPSSDVYVRPLPQRVGCIQVGPRTALSAIRRRRGVLGPRALLHAIAVAEWHSVLCVRGSGLTSLWRQHEDSDRRACLRHGLPLHAGGDRARGAVVPGDLAHGRNRRLRCALSARLFRRVRTPTSSTDKAAPPRSAAPVP